MAVGIQKSKSRELIIGLPILLCIIYGYFYVSAAGTSGEDVSECKVITDFVQARSSIPKSVSAPDRPGIFCDVELRGLLLQRFDHVRIYGVTDKDQQDAIVAILKPLRVQSQGRELTVDFYEKENWKTWSDPATHNRAGERGPETSMRQVVIK